MKAKQNGLAYEIASKAGIEFQNTEMRAILDRLANWTKQNSNDDGEFGSGYNAARAFVQNLIAEYQAKPLDEPAAKPQIETYSYSVDEEHYTGRFSSREEAIEEARADRFDPFWTARNREPEMNLGYLFSADRIIKKIVEGEEDFYLECAEGWPDCTPEQESELTAALENAFNGWMDRHRLRPDFWIAEDVQEHKLEGDK